MSKTANLLRGIAQTILTCGGVVSIICFTLLLLNTEWWYEHNSISVAIRGVEIFIGLELLAFYIRYTRDVNRVVRRKKDRLKSYHNFEQILKKTNRKHTKVKVDMLFAGALSYVLMFVVTRGVSYATFRYSHFIDTFYINTIIQIALHLGMLMVPFYLWNTEEINRYFNDVLVCESVNDCTAGTKQRRVAR